MNSANQYLAWRNRLLVRKLERFRFWFARRMPRWLVYHCAIRLFAEVTASEPMREVPNWNFMEAMCKWENKS